MTPAAGPFAIAATLLAVGGALKALRPQDTANALRAVGLPGPRLIVRLGGAVEAIIGAAALVSGDRVSAALVAVSYVAFVGFVVTARRQDAPLASCGCFGKADTPPTVLHVVYNLGAAAAAIAVAADPGVGLGAVVDHQPYAAAPFVALVAIGVAFSFLALSTLPRTLVEVRPSGERR